MSEAVFLPITTVPAAANVIPFPAPVRDTWGDAVEIVAGMEAWELIGAIEWALPSVRPAIQADNIEQVVGLMYVVHAATTRFLLEIGRLPA